MLSINDFDHIYVHRQYVDFRKSINGLSIIVQEEMELDPFSKCLFIFCNQHRNRMKILYWDNSGYALWYKRLEKEKFAWPKHETKEVITITTEQLEWLLKGYSFWRMKAHKKLQFDNVF